MPVDIGNVLHVLVHELRTPAGIAQGYLRMLADDRLTEPADRRKAMEQAQKAVTRITEIASESSRLAGWFDRADATKSERIDARALIDRVVNDAAASTALLARVDVEPSAGAVETVDADTLAAALVAITKATARELGNQPCAFSARLVGQSIDMWIGAEQQFGALGAGPSAVGAGPLALERGGVGLSLVFAAAVLETHGAMAWTTNGSRSTVGIRLPIGERALQ
jgi:signal transduction histidine kinase